MTFDFSKEGRVKMTMEGLDWGQGGGGGVSVKTTGHIPVFSA